MTDEVVRFEVENSVALITLNRPESLNAMNAELGAALSDALRKVRDTDEIRVGIITGTGRAFCAGADLKERAARGSGGGGDTPGDLFATSPRGGYAEFEAYKPLIAAINGFALAGGLELALICDIRIASSNAQFGVPEITRGFFPGAGAPQRLPRFIPEAVAMEMLLTGDPIDAEAALRVGLVSHVVEPEALLPTARRIGERVAGHAPLAVRAVREVARASADMSMAQAMRFGNSLRWAIGQTEDAKEGPRAFAEKRAPVYRGR